MPFPNQTPRVFNRGNIEAIKPNQKGCYGLFTANTWIYIGKADCIRTRLLEHLNGDNPCINRLKPTHWVDVVTNNNVAEEKRLIVEYQPVCNKKVG